jgi:splicing factor 3A subunit 1
LIRDILRLTALFHARRGRAFLSSLSVREGRNYQFDFLRPTHSLYGYYNRMVESYQKIMQPPPGQIDNLVKAASDPMGRWGILEEGKNRAEWEKYRRRKEDIKQKEKDDEAEADAVIDWQDFVLVETIEFTQSDMELNLPPPSSIEELRNRSMGEKRMASMIMEETGAGAAPTSAGKGSAPGSAGMPGAPTGPRSQRQPQAQQQAKVEDEEMEMDEEEEEEAEELRLQRIKEEKEQARARDIQRAAMESRGMKIKKDYVPKGMSITLEGYHGIDLFLDCIASAHRK